MKPILFSTEMVRAIIEGRKTMTRRVIKFPDGMTGRLPDNGFYDGTPYLFWPCGIKRPKYKVGDILWVRETWQRVIIEEDEPEDILGYVYRASPETYEDYGLMIDGEEKPLPWKPSIFMPKEAARLFLKVTSVQVEHLQEILCGDMKREGCIPATVTGGQYQQWQRDYWIPLWDSINKKRGYGWNTNPWVWVYEFERCEKEDDHEQNKD